MQAVTIGNDPCLCCGDVERVMKRVEPYTCCLWCFERRFGDSEEIRESTYRRLLLEQTALERRMLRKRQRAPGWFNDREIGIRRLQSVVDEARNC